MMCLLALLEKATIQPFKDNASEMFQTRFNLDKEETVKVIMGTFTMVFIPLGLALGYLTDKRGYKGYVMVLGCALLALAHAIFFSFDSCEDGDKSYAGILPMTLIGIANTLIQLTLYPSINYLVSEWNFGTAYGLIEASCNVGHILGSLVIGSILNSLIDIDEAESVDVGRYQVVNLVLFVTALVSVAIGLQAVRLDMRSKHGKNVLNKVFTFPERLDESGDAYDSSDASIDGSLRELEVPLLLERKD